jgi:hypothetical protein
MRNNLLSLAALTALLFFILPGKVTAIPNPAANVTIHFTGMTPHLNQDLYLRVVDKGTRKETGRIVQQISSVDFDIVLDAVTPGRSYFIDFFADFNSNGLYDAPPTDHTWRLELNNAIGGDELNFAHNTNFTDIKWVYLLTVNFTGMTPHLGQLLELRVEDNATDKEVDRIKVPVVPSADFNVQIAGLKLNTEYKIEFYADHNGNGLYDAPPTDHAWEIDFTNTTGDVTQDFAHNTTFTDINWKYLLTVNFFAMSPHLGQLFLLRVVRQDNQEEIGRDSLLSVLVPDFTIYIPEFELEHGYNIDFFADHNGNGIYDSPPADHAWRLTFNSSTGDIVQDFTHNTNFTDIEWPNIVGIEDDGIAALNDYALLQNYPNPFNPVTTIKYFVPDESHVRITVYNVIGKEITELVNEKKDAGSYEVSFDASSLASGIYFYKLQAAAFSSDGGQSFTKIKKMVLLK